MNLFYDLLITIGIIITAIPAVILLYSRKKRKKSWEYKYKKTTLLISIILLLGTLTLIYGSFIESNIIIIQRYEVDLDKIKNPVKIAFLADFQLGKYKQNEWTKKIVEKIIKLKPDIVLLGGDQVDNEKYSPEEFDFLKPLEKLAREIPVYAIHGNHEYGVCCPQGVNEKCKYTGNVSAETKQAMEKIGIKYLVNEMEKIDINSSTFFLYGADSYWSKKIDYSVLDQRTENIPTIALIHNPSFYFSDYPQDIDLILSGHTHGGQIRLPFLGPIGLVDNLLPKKYYQGLHDLTGQTKLLVTSGIGETGTRARLLNPPEIVMLTIK